MKMKIIKISILATLILLAIVGIISIIVVFNNKKTVEGYHTVLESKSYVCEENRRMTFNVYSETYQSLINDTKHSNYILKMSELSFELENVEVKRYKLDDITLIKIYADLPQVSRTISSDSAKLIIVTTRYQLSLKLGTISILALDEYELLGVDRLYGTYSVVEGVKHLVGVNIKFSQKFNKIRDFKIGEYSYGNLNQMVESNEIPNEINIIDLIPNYNIYRVERTSDKDISDKTYFIPINYITLAIIREGYITVVLDDKKYYIDMFSFMSNDFDYETYKDIMKDGEKSD